MKTLIATVLLVATMAAAQSEVTNSPDSLSKDWRSRLTPTRQGRFPAIRPMHVFYQFGWGNITSARGSVEFSRPAPGISKAELEAHTTGFVRSLWRMDTRAVAYADLVGLRPLRVRQAEWYHGGTSLAAQEFTPKEVLRGKGATPGDPAPDFFTNAPADAARLRELTHVRAKPIKLPDLFDLQTALLFVRSQPLVTGDVIRLAIVQGNSPYLAKLRVLGRERVTVPAGTFPAIKLELTLQDIMDDFSLAPQKRFTRALGWFSDDENRLFLKLETAIFVGSVWAQLEKVDLPPAKPARPAATPLIH